MKASSERWVPLRVQTFEGLRPALHMAAGHLGWILEQDGVDELRFSVKGGARSFGEWFIIRHERNGVLFRSECVKSQMIAYGKNRANVNDFLRTLRAVLAGQQGMGQSPESAGVPAQEPRIFHLSEAFMPRRNAWATPLLLWSNILLWLIMVLNGVSAMNPDTLTLFNWGGNFGPATVSGDFWRLGTAVFLHSGLIHLALNMVSLAALGQLLESVTGSRLLLLLYLATGLVASLASILFHAPIVSVGASGAIMGVAGVLLGMLVLRRKHIFPAYPDLLRNIAISLMPTFLYGFTSPQVDNAAHIGGLAGGFVLGLAIAPLLRPEGKQKAFLSLMPLALSAACLLFTITLGGKLSPSGPADPFEASQQFNRLRDALIQNEAQLNALLNSGSMHPDSLRKMNGAARRGVQLSDSIMNFPTFNAEEFQEIFELQRERYALLDSFSLLMLEAENYPEEEVMRKQERLGRALERNNRNLMEAEKKLK